MDAITKVTPGMCVVGSDWSKTQIIVVETSEVQK